ncbi:helix-turn-helix domain-containing protein [Nocardia macrotermitis]|uniref:HTH cro/C1-type domain-containing protein n=1 Tax=Nocardia macrotermitis TaxID=2585198 RepID=A0A7K0D8I8_9NOCA|nr:helix-turn-helix domain-containing protein [Nocardia macrotermitis]MQY22037.1 hypothetical protein [Nocardia macrotermitis]
MVAWKVFSRWRTSTTPADPLTTRAGRQLITELGRLKQNSGLSFTQLSDEIPYARATVARYVRGDGAFPPRQAVHDIAQACGADPAPLLELWDTATTATPPHRRYLLAGGGAVAAFAVALLVVAFTFGDTSKTPSPTSGCRPYKATLQVYTVGTMCWTDNKNVHVKGELIAQADARQATAQLCVAWRDRPNPGCTRVVDLAQAQPGHTQPYDLTVDLPPGHGAWVHACMDYIYCSSWS